MVVIEEEWGVPVKFYEVEDIVEAFQISEATARKFLKKYGFKLVRYYIEEKKLLEILKTTGNLLEQVKR